MRPVAVDLVGRWAPASPAAIDLVAAADRWLADRTGVSDDVAPAVLALAGRSADAARVDRMIAELHREPDRNRHAAILAGLRELPDPARAFQLLFDDSLDVRETVALLDRATDDAAYRFVVASWDRLATRLPEQERANLVRVAGALCSKEARAEAEAFFAPRATSPRRLALALERIDLCVALRAKQAPELASWLGR
jgi:alanyl aminopeptidase